MIGNPVKGEIIMRSFDKKPEEVKQIFNDARKITIKPVESMADSQFEKHGREFYKNTINSVVRKNP
jgi:hypothetical protein